jgi:molybdate transport system substrate-binding protein
VKRLGVVASALLLLALAACGSGPDSSGSSDSSGAAPRRTTLTVFAAASLTSTFTDIGKKFESRHKGVTVKFSFGGSSDLVAQIQQGAPADVFASADTANMDKLTADHLEAATPTDFATNTLEIATPPDDPAGIATFQDLARKGVKLVMCAAEVPCGAAAHKVESAAGVRLKPVSEEQSVTDVLSKVTSGEADAGLVYVTDVKGAGSRVRGVTFPEASSAVNTYPIAPVRKSKHAALARQFVSTVTGATGQAILARAGFAKP